MRAPRKTIVPPTPNNGGAGKGCAAGAGLAPALLLLLLPPRQWCWGRGGFLCALCLLSLGPVCAAPPTSTAPTSTAPTSTAIPDYGGRDSAPLAAGDNAPNPAAQAGRAVEALVIVLAGVIGVVYALKRLGLVQGGADGKPARIMLSGLGRSLPLPSSSAEALSSPVTVESSQALPGGAMLHMVRVPGRTLLLAATSQTITAVADWPAEAETSEESVAFEEYLARADAPESGIAAANARLRSLLSRPQPPSSKETP